MKTQMIELTVNAQITHQVFVGTYAQAERKIEAFRQKLLKMGLIQKPEQVKWLLVTK